MRRPRLLPPLLLATAVAAISLPGCRRTIYDIVTSERIVRVPRSSGTEFTVETGRIALPAQLGTDKVVDSATLEMTATNRNRENRVVVDLSAAVAERPGTFGPIARFEIPPGGSREIEVVQSDPGDVLVRATQTDAINIRFDSTSPRPGIGELEFRFTIRVLAHKATPGTGAGTLLFY